MDSRREMAGVEEIEAEESRGAAADLDGGHRAGRAEDGGAPGEPDEVGGVADQEAGDVGEAAHLSAAGRRGGGARRPARRLGGEPAGRDLAGDLEAPLDERAQEGDAAERCPGSARARATATARRGFVARPSARRT